MGHAAILEVSNAGAVREGAADVTPHSMTAADLGAALADEIGRLDTEGRKLQTLAARLAQDTRREFEAWFEAGLLLRRASERLAEIAQQLA